MSKPDYKSQIAQLEAKIQTLTTDIAVKNDKISELTTEKENLSRTVRIQEEESQANAKDYAKNTQILTDKVNTITKQYKSQEDLFKLAREEIKKSGEELAVLHENYDKTNEILEILRNENTKILKENDLLTEVNRKIVEKLDRQLRQTNIFKRIFGKRKTKGFETL